MNLEGTNVQNVTSNSEKLLRIALPTINSDNLCQSAMEDFNDKTDTHMLQSTAKEESNDASQEFNQKDSYIMDNGPVRNEDENSQDSLLQHMQDMFCESDDSSDLTRLIEEQISIKKLIRYVRKQILSARIFLMFH